MTDLFSEENRELLNKQIKKYRKKHKKQIELTEQKAAQQPDFLTENKKEVVLYKDLRDHKKTNLFAKHRKQSIEAKDKHKGRIKEILVNKTQSYMKWQFHVNSMDRKLFEKQRNKLLAIWQTCWVIIIKYFSSCLSARGSIKRWKQTTASAILMKHSALIIHKNFKLFMDTQPKTPHHRVILSTNIILRKSVLMIKDKAEKKAYRNVVNFMKRLSFNFVLKTHLNKFI